MATINLLPWREERREELQKAFLTVLAAVVLLAFALVWAANQAVSASIEQQQARNSYLKKNIAELNAQVREIRNLGKKKKELLARMKVIQQLQGNRPIIVRVFDEMVKTLPDGVYYRSLSLKGRGINVKGTSESNNRISSLMRRVNSSEWFASPNLTDVKANKNFGDQASNFNLSFKIATPSSTSGVKSNKKKGGK